MKRLLVLAVTVAASFGVGSAASAGECPKLVCGALDQCYDTGEVRFCL